MNHTPRLNTRFQHNAFKPPKHRKKIEKLAHLRYIYSDDAITWLRNRRCGPGGSTQQLHHYPPKGE